MSVQDNHREREREILGFFFFYTYFGLNRTDSWPVSNWIGLYWPELGWIGKWEKKYAFAATLTAAQHIHACRTRVLIQSVHLCFPGCMVCNSSLSYVGSLEEVEHPYFWSCGEIYPWTQIYLTFFFFPNVMGVSCNSIVDFMDHINLHL